MNRRSFSLDTFRNRVANLEALPQFALLGVLSGIITGLVILVLRQAIKFPLRYWLSAKAPPSIWAPSLAVLGAQIRASQQQHSYSGGGLLSS